MQLTPTKIKYHIHKTDMWEIEWVGRRTVEMYSSFTNNKSCGINLKPAELM